jgi:acetyl-CoA C-acetyltransferase
MMPPGREQTGSDVIIVGAGMTPVKEYWDISLRELALQSIVEARQEAPEIHPEALYVANMLAPSVSAQSQLGTLIADFAGLRGIEAMSIEAGGASGGAALRQAYFALKSGQIHSALVIGVEKVTDRVGPFVAAALATGTDADYEAIQGVTPTTQAALLMRRYLHEHDAPEDALAGYSINAHLNGEKNPYAMFRRAIDIEQYHQAPMISDPVNMYDAAPLADGSASMLLTRRDALPKNGKHPGVQLLACTLSTSALAVHDRPDPLKLDAAEKSIAEAFALTGVKHDDIDLFELHDQFSVLAALMMEAAGFAPFGSGWKLARDGQIQLKGAIPITTFGGSKARGDVGGATGIFQAVEVIRQLQGLAGENQVVDAHLGMAQCLGGVGSIAATSIFALEG